MPCGEQTRYWCSMLLLSLLLACDPSKSDTAPVDSGEEASYLPPTERGPWAVGTSEGTLTRESGEEMAVQVWYPANETDDGSASRYAYDGLTEGTALEHSTPDCAEARPVLVFSHGSGGIRWQSIFYTEHLASRGWVVVAPDHAGNTFLDDDDERMAEMALLRPADVALAFDWLGEQVADGAALAGCADMDAGYAVSGHSYGGYTSVAVAGATLDVAGLEASCAESDEFWCEILDTWKVEHPDETEADLSDPRAWASVPMTPAGATLFGAGVANVGVPMAILAGTLDDITPADTEAQPIFDGLEVAPRAIAVVDGAGHLSFSDACLLVSTLDECGEGYLPVADVQRITLAVSVAFLDWIRGDADAREQLPPNEDALSWTLTE